MSSALKTPFSVRKKNPVMKVFKKGGRDAELPSTAPNTPEDEPGVTVVASEIDPSTDPLSSLMLSPPSPLLGHHRSYSSKSSAVREEKKEETMAPTNNSTSSSDDPVVTAVSKTLNFFDDMCQLPTMPSETEEALEEYYPQLLTNDSIALDDTTTSSFVLSDTTGLSTSMCSHTNSTSMHVSKRNNMSQAPDKGIPRSPSHDHENFEVVLDPASLLNEEQITKPVKPQKAKRWPRLSKSLASSLTAQRKVKQHESPNGNTAAVPPLENKAARASFPSTDRAPATPRKVLEDLEAPLDEEIGVLLGAAAAKPQHGDSEEEDALASAEAVESSAKKDAKSSTGGSGGPKVLAKIWKKAKKIGQGDKKQSHHRAEVDDEAAVARRSMELLPSIELDRSLEEQDFLNQGCPKQDVEPIMEENESDIEGDSDANGNAADEQHASAMANAWNNIFTSITNTLDPELAGADACGVTRTTKSLLNTSTESSNVNSSMESSYLSSLTEGDDELNASRDEQPKQVEANEAPATAVESVEVSNTTKKATPSKAALLGHRLKRIQKSAYFKNNKKRAGKSKAKAKSKSKSPETNRKATQQRSRAEASGAKSNAAAGDSSPVSLVPPKLVWKSVVDPNSGRTYYYHRKTRATTWSKPQEYKQYQSDYKKWMEAVAAASPAERAAAEAAAEENSAKAPEETKEEEKAPVNTLLRSSSLPTRAVSSGETEGKAEAEVMKRTPSNPLERCVMIPLQMPDTTGEETQKSASSSRKTIESIPEETANEEDEQEEKEEKAKEEVGQNKQPFDEAKPFDESPFDEPMTDTGPGLLFLPQSPKRLGRTMTYQSKASARSALTDRTEKIKNTGKGKFSAIKAINGNRSAATSISSYDRPTSPSPRVPSRVPVVRERQLMIEELTDARISAESYEGVAGEKRGRIVKGRPRERIETTRESLYDVDNDTLEGYAASTFDNDTYGTDSVSALSENDTDFLSRRDNFDQARRRALDAAIEIEDWDLAAALSDGMRAANLPGGYEKAHSSWNQSELDKFIANNDWNAVKSYIARMREQSKKQHSHGMSSRRKDHASSANKRVGSRSQIQHREIVSEDSWSGSESESSYETYDSESQI